MKREMVYVIGEYIMLVLLFSVMIACEKETSDSEIGDYEPVDVSVEMNVAAYQNQQQTRADLVLPGDIGKEETVIHNMTVFQFDGEGNDTDKLVVVRYIDSGLDAITLGLMQPKSAPDKNQYLYFVANTGDQLQDFTGVYADLKQRLISVNEAGIADGNMVMTASLVTKISALQPIRVAFCRKLAKINVTCTIREGVNFTPARLQLRNVPKSFSLVNTLPTFPAADAGNFQNYISVTDNINGGYTWYIPENLRGTGSATVPKDKTANTAPSGQGEYCTYVELSGLYQEGGTSKLVSYRVYLGGNNTNDYNVEANRIYNVNLSVVGADEVDNRIEVVVLPEAEKPANCYMVSPGTTVVIDLLKSPGEAVPNSGVDYATRVGTLSVSKIKSVGIVWQTEDTPDGLIQELTFLESTGQAMFKASDGASGNLLLAAYSEPKQQGTILWSWHIWITDYKPEEYKAGSSLVSGGNVYYISQDGGTWMDRDLGALTATAGAATTIGYAYQWGRKDPFPLSNGISAMILRPLYDAEGNYLRSGAAIEVHDSGELNLIQNAIAHPWIFFTTTEGHNDMTKGWWWKGATEFALWSDDVKTMYDPCPAGWRLPSSTIVAKVTVRESTVTSDNAKFGALYRSIMWYQFSGYLSFMDGNIGEPGTTSVYWSSKINKAYQPHSLNTYIQLWSRHAGFGFIGRCVKDTSN